jgi:DNA-binding MarR family transcriptional regulator
VAEVLGADSSDAARLMECLPAVRRAMGSEVTLGDTGETMPLGQFFALQVLADGDRTAGELARVMIVTLPTLTQIVDGLVEHSWAERFADPADRRKVGLRITGTGRAALEVARASEMERLTRVLRHLSAADRRGLIRGLEALREAIRLERPSTKTGHEVAGTVGARR